MMLSLTVNEPPLVGILCILEWSFLFVISGNRNQSVNDFDNRPRSWFLDRGIDAIMSPWIAYLNKTKSVPVVIPMRIAIVMIQLICVFRNFFVPGCRRNNRFYQKKMFFKPIKSGVFYCIIYVVPVLDIKRHAIFIICSQESPFLFILFLLFRYIQLLYLQLCL